MANEGDAASLPRLPARKPGGHKGSYGHVLVVGGSVGMSGAPALTGMAALRAGAGLVSVACPEAILPVVAAFNPCYLTHPLPGGDRFVTSAASDLATLSGDVVAVGPGMGRQLETQQTIRDLAATDKRPLVIDADGLNAIAGHLDNVSRRAQNGWVTVLTPHPGEFERLSGAKTPTDAEGRSRVAAQFAKTCQVVLLLKGQGTVVTDGEQLFVNKTGNPGMATGGTGDVLTGIIAALLAQGMSPFEAACLGAHVHGLAGDLAAERFGQVSLIASDLIDHLGEAFRRAASLTGGGP